MFSPCNGPVISTIILKEILIYAALQSTVCDFKKIRRKGPGCLTRQTIVRHGFIKTGGFYLWLRKQLVF